MHNPSITLYDYLSCTSRSHFPGTLTVGRVSASAPTKAANLTENSSVDSVTCFELPSRTRLLQLMSNCH